MFCGRVLGGRTCCALRLIYTVEKNTKRNRKIKRQEGEIGEMEGEEEVG